MLKLCHYQFPLTLTVEFHSANIMCDDKNEDQESNTTRSPDMLQFLIDKYLTFKTKTIPTL